MSKLGFYLRGEVDLDRIIAARPRVMVVMDDVAALVALHDALADRCLLVAGQSGLGTDWGAFWCGPAGEDLDRALDLWFEAARPLLAGAPFAFSMSFDGPEEPDLLPSFAAFETARVKRLAGDGLRACVGNFPTGLPDPAAPLWKEFLPACRAAAAQGGVLGLHECGALYLWTGYGSNEWLGSGFRAERKFPEEYRINGTLCLHYRPVYERLLAPVGLGRLPLIVTACGLGATADAITAALSHGGQPTGGWQSCVPTWRRRDGVQDAADFYARQLQWYDAQIERDPYVLGAAVYAWGTGDAHEIAGEVADRLLAHIAAGPEPTGPLTPEPASEGLSAVAAVKPSAEPSAESSRVPQRTPGGKRYYITVDHPEIFDALWRQGEGAAEAAGAVLTWREVGGRFVLQTDSAAIWRELFLYGQVLAQTLGAEIDGGEISGQQKA